MKKFLKLLVCASLAFHFPLSAPLSASAQITHASQGNLDEVAKAILDKAAKKLQNMSGVVTLSILDSQKKITAQQSARVYYSKGRYRLVMDAMEIVSDGTTVWQWDKKAKEIVVNNVPANDGLNLLNPATLIANRDKNFRSKYIRTDPDGTAIIDLQPRSSQSYHKLRLFVVEETGLLRRVEVHKYDSSREIYVFDNITTSSIKTPFVINTADHPDAEVIDMR